GILKSSDENQIQSLPFNLAEPKELNNVPCARFLKLEPEILNPKEHIH
ncbi:10322_t:CDS:1, partial [Ambispora leptoticha]